MAGLPGAHGSFWAESVSASSYDPLTEDHECDVCVIGGGIVGITTAFVLAERGVRVCLLEARRLVEGVSGHTTAKVTSLHGAVYHQLADRHGEDTARRYARANQEALEWIVRTIAGRSIECDLGWGPAYTVASSAHNARTLEREAEVAQGLGLPVRYVDGPDLEAPMEALAGVRLDGQAHFHPRAYLYALADAAHASGASIFERTRAEAVKDRGSEKGRRLTVRTSTHDPDAGRTEAVVEADRVVVATGLPFLRSTTVFMRTMPLGHHVLAVESSSGTPEGMYLSQDSHPRSVRPYAGMQAGISIVAGHGRRTGHGSALRDARTLVDAVSEQLPGASILNRWWTEDWYSFDVLPFVGKMGALPHVFGATGFGGWGMTNGTAASLILADMVEDRDNEHSSLYDPGRVRVTALDRQFLQHNIDSATRHFVVSRLDRRSTELEAIGEGEGRVLPRGIGHVAVSRDAGGSLNAVSARCPHLGCIVEWNDSEETWDCPCHGARFFPDGTLLNGPAFADLETVEVEG